MNAVDATLIAVVILFGVVTIALLLFAITYQKYPYKVSAVPITVSTSNLSVAKPRDFEIVVSRYGEDLNWLRNESLKPHLSRVVIYNKGRDNLPKKISSRVKAVIQLPNVGRCDHSYLHHIIEGLKQQKLADFTIFVTASAWELNHKRLMLLEALSIGTGTAREKPHIMTCPRKQLASFQLDEWAASSKLNFSENPEKKLYPAPQRPLGTWFDVTFPAEYTTFKAPLFYGGVFYATAEGIQRTPLYIYEKLLEQCAAHSNPEVGHYIERVWGILTNRRN